MKGAGDAGRVRTRHQKRRPVSGANRPVTLDCGNDLGGRRGEQGSHCRLGYSMRLVLSDLDVVAGRLDIPVAQQLAQLKHVDTAYGQITQTS